MYEQGIISVTIQLLSMEDAAHEIIGSRSCSMDYNPYKNERLLFLMVEVMDYKIPAWLAILTDIKMVSYQDDDL